MSSVWLELWAEPACGLLSGWASSSTKQWSSDGGVMTTERIGVAALLCRTSGSLGSMDVGACVVNVFNAWCFNLVYFVSFKILLVIIVGKANDRIWAKA